MCSFILRQWAMLIMRYAFYLGHYSLITRTAQSLLTQSPPHLYLPKLSSANQVCSLPPGVIQPSFWKSSSGAWGGLGKEQSLKKYLFSLSVKLWELLDCASWSQMLFYSLFKVTYIKITNNSKFKPSMLSCTCKSVGHKAQV